jgi:hypothetical protein
MKRLRQHLARPELTQADQWLSNMLMLERLEESLQNGVPVVGADLSFYLHELTESAIMDEITERNPEVALLVTEFPIGLIVNHVYFMSDEIALIETSKAKLNDLPKELSPFIAYKYAHFKALDHYQISQYSLYHEVVVRTLPAYFSASYVKFWER